MDIEALTRYNIKFYHPTIQGQTLELNLSAKDYDTWAVVIRAIQSTLEEMRKDAESMY